MLNLQKNFFNKIVTGDVKGAVEIFAEDGIFLFPGMDEMQGKRKIEFLLKRILNRFSEIQWTTTQEIPGQIPNSNLHFLTAQWNVVGTYKTNKRYENNGVSVLSLDENGRVKYFKDYFVSTDFSDS